MSAHLISIKITVAPVGAYGTQAPVAQVTSEHQVYVDPTASYGEAAKLSDGVRASATAAAAAVFDQIIAAYIDANPAEPEAEQPDLSEPRNDGSPEPAPSPSDEPASSDAAAETREPHPWEQVPDVPAPATPDEEVLEHGA